MLCVFQIYSGGAFSLADTNQATKVHRRDEGSSIGTMFRVTGAERGENT